MNRALDDYSERTMRDPVQQLLCESRRVLQAVVDAREDTLAGVGMTSIERCLMETLARENAPITVATLARRALTPVADIARALDTLDSRGWLERGAGPPQARGEVVRLNNDGRATRRAFRASERAVLAQLGVVLDEQSVRTALATLRLLRRTVQRVSIPVPPQGPDSIRATCTRPRHSSSYQK